MGSKMEQNRDERCAFRGWEKASVQGMQSIGERRKVEAIKGKEKASWQANNRLNQ
jgi:hypothetical protein